MRDADLSDADLSDADLSDADLSDADLSDADLSDADLSDAGMSDVYKMSLSVFTLVTLASLYNIRKFPTLADLHWELVTFSIIAFIIFLIPASLISAELATGWPQAGGVYVWVKEAFGERWGFTAYGCNGSR